MVQNSKVRCFGISGSFLRYLRALSKSFFLYDFCREMLSLSFEKSFRRNRVIVVFVISKFIVVSKFRKFLVLSWGMLRRFGLPAT